MLILLSLQHGRKKLFIIIPLCVLALCTVALGIYYMIDGPGGMLTLFARVDRTDMMAQGQFNGLPCRVYAPEGLVRSYEQYPLVLYLHGAGQRGDNNRAQTRKNSVMQTLLNKENLAAYPCFVLAPQCPANGWWEAEVLMGLLEEFRAEYPVDPARIYITGLSMGGYGTWAMLAAYPDYFAAAVPICGGGDPETAPLFKGVPIWAFHGAKDDVVLLGSSDEMIWALEAAGAHTKYTVYHTEKHRSWERAYREPELFSWLFAQSKEVIA